MKRKAVALHPTYQQRQLYCVGTIFMQGRTPTLMQSNDLVVRLRGSTPEYFCFPVHTLLPVHTQSTLLYSISLSYQKLPWQPVGQAGFHANKWPHLGLGTVQQPVPLPPK